MKYSIRLGFHTDGNRDAYITVPDAPATMPGSGLVSAAMDQIVASGAVRAAAGALTGPASARHYAVETVDFEI